jgi:hypothetical protein
MKQITLTREQITKLNKIVDHFNEIQHFTIVEDHSSGIGPAISVKCDLFDVEMKADITDYNGW